MSGSNTKKCFVITPIGDEMSPIRRHIEGVIDAAIEPALGDKFEICVSHRIYEQGLITKQIINEICNDELVVANLTDRNPNVMYELALRHSLGKPTIMIAEKGTPLPTDILLQRTIFYHNDAKGVLELKDELIKAEKEIAYDKESGPLVDIFKDIRHDMTVLKKVKSENGKEIGQLEYIVDRLNRIEDTLRIVSIKESSRSLELNYDSVQSFGFERFDRKLSATEIQENLNEYISKYKIAKIFSVRINNKTKIIDILFETKSSNYINKSKYIIKEALTALGFEGIMMLD